MGRENREVGVSEYALYGRDVGIGFPSGTANAVRLKYGGERSIRFPSAWSKNDHLTKTSFSATIGVWLKRCKHNFLYFAIGSYGLREIQHGTIRACTKCKKWWLKGIFGIWRKFKMNIW